MVVLVVLLLALAAGGAGGSGADGLLFVTGQRVGLLGVRGLGRNVTGGFLIGNMLVSHPIHVTLRVHARVPATGGRAQLLHTPVRRCRRLLMLLFRPDLRGGSRVVLSTVLIVAGYVRIGA